MENTILNYQKRAILNYQKKFQEYEKIMHELDLVYQKTIELEKIKNSMQTELLNLRDKMLSQLQKGLK